MVEDLTKLARAVLAVCALLLAAPQADAAISTLQDPGVGPAQEASDMNAPGPITFVGAISPGAMGDLSRKTRTESPFASSGVNPKSILITFTHVAAAGSQSLGQSSEEALYGEFLPDSGHTEALSPVALLGSAEGVAFLSGAALIKVSSYAPPPKPPDRNWIALIGAGGFAVMGLFYAAHRLSSA